MFHPINFIPEVLLICRFSVHHAVANHISVAEWPSKVHHCVLVYYYNYRLELQLSKYCSDNGRLKCYAFMHWETEILLSYSWV